MNGQLLWKFKLKFKTKMWKTTMKNIEHFGIQFISNFEYIEFIITIEIEDFQ